MGWFPMLCVIFMAMIFALYDQTPERRVNEEYTRAGTVGAQMASYHQSAYSKCRYPTVCPAGAIDPRDHMDSAVLAAGTVYNNFESVYDGSDILVTFYKPTNNSHKDDGLIVSYLGITYGYSILSGKYDSAHQEVDRGMVVSSSDPSYTINHIPSTIGGVTIPDGAPVIVTRY